MKMFKNALLAGAIAALAAGSLLGAQGEAQASGFFTNGVPPAGGTQYPNTVPLTGNEQVPADTELAAGLNPQSESITVNQLLAASASSGTALNYLIGGDATTNLWQRATSGSSVNTSTVTFGGPDRWAYVSGTGTAMTVSRDSTAANLPVGYQYDFKMARTAAQTGVVQMCMGQDISTANSYSLAGKTVELDFHAATGANFSAASQNMTAYVITGTGTDEGIAKMMFTVNAAFGTTPGWAGGALAASAVTNLQAVSTLGRYSVVAAIPATATEVGVALCYTPVGTAGANDFVAFSGIQLIKNSTLTAFVNPTVGYNDTTFQAAAFGRRAAPIEAQLQYGYYWKQTEAASDLSIYGTCQGTGVSTVANCMVSFPYPMFKAPTISYTAGNISATVGSAAAAEAVSALVVTKASTYTANLAATSSSVASGAFGYLEGGNSTGGGIIAFNAEP